MPEFYGSPKPKKLGAGSGLRFVLFGGRLPGPYRPEFRGRAQFQNTGRLEGKPKKNGVRHFLSVNNGGKIIQRRDCLSCENEGGFWGADRHRSESADRGDGGAAGPAGKGKPVWGPRIPNGSPNKGPAFLQVFDLPAIQPIRDPPTFRGGGRGARGRSKGGTVGGHALNRGTKNCCKGGGGHFWAPAAKDSPQQPLPFPAGKFFGDREKNKNFIQHLAAPNRFELWIYARGRENHSDVQCGF